MAQQPTVPQGPAGLHVLLAPASAPTLLIIRSFTEPILFNLNHWLP